MRAAIPSEVMLQVLIARERLRDAEDGIEPHSLPDRAAALPVLTTQRTYASTAALDEVHVAARELLRNRAGALAVGAAVVGSSLAAHTEDERGDGPRSSKTDESRPEHLRKLHDGLPGSVCGRMLSENRRAATGGIRPIRSRGALMERIGAQLTRRPAVGLP